MALCTKCYLFICLYPAPPPHLPKNRQNIDKIYFTINDVGLAENISYKHLKN